MFATSIIARKRDSQRLTGEEIRFMVEGFVAGEIPDYQMSAWAMAIVCRGMEVDEIAALTDVMLASGGRMSRATDRPRVDKHSTGGLGDKVSLVLSPLLACFDVDVPMLSGRGLGITGGTLDKLEAYSGFRCHLTQPQIDRQLDRIGCVIAGTTADIAPADRKLYALRDVTGTVPSIALITSSIMSKKLAASLDALVLDVKFGSAAFMRDLNQARQLADSLCATGQRFGVATRAVLSDMNQPLGRMVGNACEANEAVQVLQGAGPADVRELTLHLSAELLAAVGKFADCELARLALVEALTSGRALARFQAMVAAQGGQFDPQLELAPSSTLTAPSCGWLQQVDGQQIGQIVIGLGGGRTRLEQSIDHTVGLEMLVRVGDRIESQQPLVRIFARSPRAAERAATEILAAMTLAEQPVAPLPLIHTL
ncbi:MAG: thymidine phosphorylase [Planctomycetales bacterium]|nr:thymidine phosphorylase [Planctomycetales bacterium]MCA9182155.1 thymidine phosphorylase [Planctomycetales bacterium]